MGIFASSYTAVNLTSARVEFNPARDSPDKMWMGIVFDEQMVYTLGSEQRRAKFRRATQRGPILQSYEGGFGNLRFDGPIGSHDPLLPNSVYFGK